MEPPFISKIILPDATEPGTEVTIGLQGNWPNPSWKHEKTDIDVDSTKEKIVISYLGTSGGGLAIQVLEPFTAEINVSIPKAGKWDIIVKGRGNDQQETLLVR